jgi:hypothetical protein
VNCLAQERTGGQSSQLLRQEDKPSDERVVRRERPTGSASIVGLTEM